MEHWNNEKAEMIESRAREGLRSGVGYMLRNMRELGFFLIVSSFQSSNLPSFHHSIIPVFP
jgi:hypothetical protein